MTRRSYNQAHAEWVQRMRRENPQMAVLWGHVDAELCACAQLPAPHATSLCGAAVKAFGVAPQSPAECYAAEQCLDAIPSGVPGRGED